MAEYSKDRSLSNNDPFNSVPTYQQQRVAPKEARRSPHLYRHRMRPLFPLQRYVLGRQKQQRHFRISLLKRYTLHLLVLFVLGVSIMYSLNSASALEDLHGSRILAPADVAVNDSGAPAANRSVIAVPFDAPIEKSPKSSEEQEQIPKGAFVVLESIEKTPAQEVPAQAQVAPPQAAPAPAAPAPAAPAPAAPAPAAPAPAAPAPAAPAPAAPAPAAPAPAAPAPAAPAPAAPPPAAPPPADPAPTAPAQPTSYDDYYAAYYAAYYSTGCCIWPVRGRISSRVTRWHIALDIVSSYGTPVMAADGGRVIAAGWDNSGYGYRVIIDHGNGMSTLYAHFSRYLVNYGDLVNKRQVIGEIGATGWASGPHLHFEVRRNNYRENPYNWLP